MKSHKGNTRQCTTRRPRLGDVRIKKYKMTTKINLLNKDLMIDGTLCNAKMQHGHMKLGAKKKEKQGQSWRLIGVGADAA